MAQIKKKLIVSSLKKKGFVQDSGDHKFFHYEVDGKQIGGVYTKVSHGSTHNDYDDYLLGQMKKQLKLDTTAQVKELLTCPMSADQYKNILKKKIHNFPS